MYNKPLTLLTAPSETVHTFTQHRGFHIVSRLHNSLIGISENTDLIAGVYEGGLKVWECGNDLMDYLSKNVSLEGKRVLELGCGHGIPGIYCANAGAREVVFQDYNEEVLCHVTMTNFERNCEGKNSRFYSGGWGDFSQLGKFDIILTADTIYQVECYDSLLMAISSTLDNNGECYVACKAFYFGVGGGTESFTQAAQSKGFNVECVKEIQEIASIRHILKLKHLN